MGCCLDLREYASVKSQIGHLEEALQDVVYETEHWAEQYESDGRYKDAAYLHGRIHHDLKDENQIVATLAAVYEKIGDYPAAELAQEKKMRIILDSSDDPDEAILPEVEKLSRLLNLFHTRLQVLGSASQTYARLSILCRAANLDLEQLNTALFDQQLIELNYFDQLSISSLHIAVKKNAPNLARLLLQKGAKLNLKDDIGDTPLHIAVEHETEEMVELLLKNGANPQAVDSMGRQALHYAVEDGQESMVKVLLDHGGVKDVAVDPLLRSTLLHFAVNRGNSTIIEIILKAGSDANGKDHWGDTPLHRLMRLDPTPHLTKIVSLLLKFGAQVNTGNNYADTPLHSAAVYRRPEVVQMLLDAGADPLAVNNYGESALSMAHKWFHHGSSSRDKEILQMLNFHVAAHPQSTSAGY